jgi:hypothetical protein
MNIMVYQTIHGGMPYKTDIMVYQSLRGEARYD